MPVICIVCPCERMVRDMEVLRVIAPIIVGAVIGYFTNYIAIKMLFRPRKEVRIGGKWRVPFTPGIIPKNQGRLAGAIGNAVGGHLLNMETLKAIFEKNDTKKKLVSKLAQTLYESPAKASDFFSTDENHGEMIGQISTTLANAVMERVQQIDLVPIVTGIGKETLGDLLNHKVISMLLTEDRQAFVYERIAEAISKYLSENGQEMIRGVIEQNILELEGKPLSEIMQKGTDREGLEHLMNFVVDRVVKDYGQAILNAIDISGIVKQRVESMDVEEMERLTMSVIDKELQAVINLGAGIGAIIGAINIFI